MSIKNERDRLDLLAQLEIMDTDPEEVLDNVVKLASYICDTPISLISLVDDRRQWFKAKVGLEASETPREFAFCSHAIQGDDLFLVEDSTKDRRFKDNPLVTGAPNVIFYAGIPLKINNNQNIGTLCVIDNSPKKLTDAQKDQLRLLSKQAIAYIELRQRKKIQERISDMLTRLHNLNFKDDISIEELVRGFLQAGCELFDLDFGIQSRIDGNKYFVESCVSPNGELEVGAEFELGGTYCDAVCKAKHTITYGEVGSIDEMREHPVYVNMKLESYISTPIWINDKIYGTLNFSSHKIRKVGFNGDERKFIEIIADLISKSIQDFKRRNQLNHTFNIIDKTPLFIGMANPKTGIAIYHNQAFKEVSGKHEDESFRISDFHPEWATKIVKNEAIPKAISDGTWTGETAILDGKGNEVPVIQTIVSHLDERGELQYISTIMQDITKQKEIELNLLSSKENAIAASKAKSEFLANISHEIRTPMNGILGMTALLDQTTLSNDQREMISTINSCGENLLILLNDILDLSKIEANKLEIEITDFSLRQNINEIVSLFYFKAKEKNIALHWDVDDSIADMLVGDPNRIKQVLVNFISNALKFTLEGSICVGIKVLKDSEHETLLKIEVRDTGIGISVQNQEKIFDAFSQEDSSVTRKFGGTGLGLSICKKLVSLMGGDIGLESKQNKGSTFYFILPLKKSSLKEIQLEREADESLEDLSQIYSHKILIVEDNPINQKLAISFLSKLGYVVDLAANGEEGVTKALGSDYSLIFMDMQMPVLDGVEAAKRINKEMKSNAPAIVAMTANVFKDDRIKCKQAGMVDFISKPFKIGDFKRVIVELEENKN